MITILVRIESYAVRIPQTLEVCRYLVELSGVGVKTIEHVDRAFLIVRAIEHVGYEDSTVGALCHESSALQALSGYGYFKNGRQVEIELPGLAQNDLMGCEFQRPRIRRCRIDSSGLLLGGLGRSDGEL